MRFNADHKEAKPLLLIRIHNFLWLHEAMHLHFAIAGEISLSHAHSCIYISLKSISVSFQISFSQLLGFRNFCFLAFIPFSSPPISFLSTSGFREIEGDYGRFRYSPNVFWFLFGKSPIAWFFFLFLLCLICFLWNLEGWIAMCMIISSRDTCTNLRRFSRMRLISMLISRFLLVKNLLLFVSLFSWSFSLLRYFGSDWDFELVLLSSSVVLFLEFDFLVENWTGITVNWINVLLNF